MFGKTEKLFKIASIEIGSYYTGTIHHYRFKPVNETFKYIKACINTTSKELHFEIKETKEKYAIISIKGNKKLINKAVEKILLTNEKFLKYFKWGEI